MFGGRKKDLTDIIFDLRMAGKQFDRAAKKADQTHEIEKRKVAEALKKKQTDVAAIYAENAVRKRNEQLNWLRMSAKMDAISSRISTASTMNSIAKNIGELTKGIDKAMSSMDLEKISQIMGNFEKQFEDLDIKASAIENSMDVSTATSAPQSQINSLMKQVAEENNIELNLAVDRAPLPGVNIGESSRKEEDDILTRRLEALRQ
ncbi:Charged multivesicular body protein 1A [Cichlidogyrus casuarinus]|uniref:Charged multivesicular body protein 1A n=1 Tax=Cichlidogyrus casuarinus TaxID=1844966 RepID=A0ABD2QH77_9PLAT